MSSSASTTTRSVRGPLALVALLPLLAGCGATGRAGAGGEASLELPDLSQVTVLGGMSGRLLLGLGLVVCALGLAFGVATYLELRRLPDAPPGEGRYFFCNRALPERHLRAIDEAMAASR